MSMDYSEKNIVFYDGDCGFCNRTVKIILKWEKNSDILFATLQSEFAKEFFLKQNAPQPDLSTFYFFTNHSLNSKSNGALALIPFLKWPFRILYIMCIFPKSFRDRIYDFIAKRRRLISKDFCILPDEKLKQRFIPDSCD